VRKAQKVHIPRQIQRLQQNPETGDQDSEEGAGKNHGGQRFEQLSEIDDLSQFRGAQETEKRPASGKGSRQKPHDQRGHDKRADFAPHGCMAKDTGPNPNAQPQQLPRA